MAIKAKTKNTLPTIVIRVLPPCASLDGILIVIGLYGMAICLSSTTAITLNWNSVFGITVAIAEYISRPLTMTDLTSLLRLIAHT